MKLGSASLVIFSSIICLSGLAQAMEKDQRVRSTLNYSLKPPTEYPTSVPTSAPTEELEEETCPPQGCDLDCDALTECYWPGFNASNVGDGFCDTSACYNSKICGFDGGDCCEETCEDGEYECGAYGYDCKRLRPTCPDKLIRITAFCIDGVSNDTEDIGAYRVALQDDDDYYPAGESCDCNGTTTEDGFCELNKANGCLEMASSEQVEFEPVSGSFSLRVGFQEAGEDCPTFGWLPAEQWYSGDCRPYAVVIYKDFEGGRGVQACYSITGGIDSGVSASVPLKGVGGVGGNATSGLPRCLEFTAPEEAYIWYLEVVPEDPPEVL